jgi:hypothetical protein
MGTETRSYRLYCFDEARKIVLADWLKAIDDVDAIARAEAGGYGTRCELWDGRRLVAELSSAPPQDSRDRH